MTAAQLIAMIKEAITDPRQSAGRVLALPLPKASVFEALVMVSALAVIGVYFVALISARLEDTPIFLPGPFVLAGLQLAAMMILAGALALMGRAFGGKGSFDGSLRIMIWLQFLMVLLQAIQLVALVILPPLAGILSLASLGLIGWISVGLVAGLHGFRSLGLTFIGIIGGMVGVSLILVILLAPFLPAPV